MRHINIYSLLKHKPLAVATVVGNPNHPNLHGTVSFYQTKIGVIVVAEILGLPVSNDVCRQPIFAFHIHDGDSCSGNATDAFANAGTHYNPKACHHPYHAGDLPPLFGADGTAFSVFLTNRFTVREITGKTVIIHSSPDDFTSQPAGNAGVKIACGTIKAR